MKPKPPKLTELAEQLVALNGASDDSLIRMVSSVQNNIEDVLGALIAQLPGRPEGKGHVFCYGRQSKDDTIQIHTKEGQEWEFKEYHKRKLADLELRWPPFFDVGVSGGVPLFRRPAGSRLNEFLRRGDHLVITKLDRAFRSKLDGWRTIKSFEQRGISVHIVNMGLDMSTPVGKVMFSVLLTFAEFERDMTSVRNKETAATMKRNGYKKPFMARPIGWKWVGKKADRRLVPDEGDRKFAHYCLDMLEITQSLKRLTRLLQLEGVVNYYGGKPINMFRVRRIVMAAVLDFPKLGHMELFKEGKRLGIRLGEHPFLDRPLTVNGHVVAFPNEEIKALNGRSTNGQPAPPEAPASTETSPPENNPPPAPQPPSA